MKTLLGHRAITRGGAGFAAALLLMTVGVSSVEANQFTFSASGTNNIPNPISASVTFNTNDVTGTLTVVLTNTYATQIKAGGADALTGVYFNLVGASAVSPTSAALTAGSVMLPGTTSASTIGANWGYITAPSGVPGVPAGDVAIGSTGLVGGSGNYDFTGAYHKSPGYLDGPSYGILGNAADTYGGFSPLEATSVTFNLSYSGSISNVTGIAFLYGTSVGEGFIKPPPSVPDSGATIALLGLALLGLAAFRRRIARN